MRLRATICLAVLVLIPDALALDMDGDGLDDEFEMSCAQRLKPVVYRTRREFKPATPGLRVTRLALNPARA